MARLFNLANTDGGDLNKKDKGQVKTRDKKEGTISKSKKQKGIRYLIKKDKGLVISSNKG